MTAARIDLHAHTSVSEDRERIALPRGASITIPVHAVTRPCDAYDLALARGMTHVTFTDHDTIEGCLELLDRHPDPSRFIIGEELTCWDRGCCFHVGVYGHNETQHAELHAGAERAEPERHCLRWNLDRLLEYLDDQNLVYDLKHPVWQREESRAAIDHLAVLLERFPRVEAINGTRRRELNELGTRLTQRLRGGAVAFTAGSDTHTDNYAWAYTETFGETPAEVLASLRAGHCQPAGRHGTHRLLDYDCHHFVAGNWTQRAGLLAAMADEWAQGLPQMVQDTLSVASSAVVAYAVVTEYDRQLRLARQVEAAFDRTLREVYDHGRDLVASD